MSTSTQWCEECGTRQEFERPPCQDGHGEDCPEWACTVCGLAHVDAGTGLAAPAAGGSRDVPAA